MAVCGKERRGFFFGHPLSHSNRIFITADIDIDIRFSFMRMPPKINAIHSLLSSSSSNNNAETLSLCAERYEARNRSL